MHWLAGRSVILLFGLCGFLFFPDPAGSFPQTATAQAQQIHALRQVEEKWLINEDNPDVVAAILADDFVHVLPTGCISKEQQIDYLRKHKAGSSAITRHFEGMRVRVYGHTGIVNGIVVAENKSDGTIRKTLFTDVFVLRDSHWLAVNSQELPYAPPPQSSHP